VPRSRPNHRRARRTFLRSIGTEPIYEFSFTETPPNEVISALENLDDKLTPNRGLRVLRNGKLENAKGFVSQGRVLLLVHGTFSKSDMFVEELGSIVSGQEFLSRASPEARST
jgi:hypothetical protein